MFRIKVAFALIVLAASIATAKVMAQDTKVVAQNTSNHSIGTHQIDRFEAIHLLQESLKSNPNDAAAWIVLGELAHEVAQDLSSQDDEPYYKLSEEAYEKVLALQPKNAGLKAAVDFAREQKADAAHWDQARKKAASSYIGVRKRELAASGFQPDGPNLFTSDATDASSGRRGNQFRPGKPAYPDVPIPCLPALLC